MGGKSSKSHFIGIRVSNEAYAEYKRLVETSPTNPHNSVGQMIKWVVEWYPFRHTSRKYKVASDTIDPVG